VDPFLHKRTRSLDVITGGEAERIAVWRCGGLTEAGKVLFGR